MVKMKTKGRKKRCIFCNHPVSGGGNRHAKYHCPPPQGKRGDKHERKHEAKERHMRASTLQSQRRPTPRPLPKMTSVWD